MEQFLDSALPVAKSRSPNSMHGLHYQSEVEVPTLIVGAGPVGLLTAYMLSKHGVKSLLIEKYTERLAAPKAHALCPRSLEICRQYGMDTAAIRRLGSSRKDAYYVNFVTNLSGERIGVLPYERMDAAVLDATPEMIHNVPQPDFEQFVARQLERDPNVTIMRGFAYETSEQQHNQVLTTVLERSTSNRCQIRSTYILACDGAKSQVREALGIDCDGEDGYETMMTIHFKADLRPVVEERVGMLHWITDPACSGFIIAYDLGGNQVLISNFNSNRRAADTWDMQLARDTVAAAIGQEVPFEVMSYRPWVLSRKVAKQYAQGNVFLVGDAAHAFPPTGGLGLNSGLADAHNLAYKIAFVHKRKASPSILKTYEEERRQIALVNSAQSVKNGKTIFSFLKTLGTAGIEDVQEARANLQRSIHDPEKQEMIAHEVEEQREHFDNLGIHIGYVYGDRHPPKSASKFTPQFVPGARLPHAWIKPISTTCVEQPRSIDVSYVHEFSTHQITSRQFSTLDLIGFEKFTLITSSLERCTQLHESINQSLQTWGTCVIIKAADDDFTFTEEIQGKRFKHESGLSRGGALLVRPDQHLLGCLGPHFSAKEVVDLILSHIE